LLPFDALTPREPSSEPTTEDAAAAEDEGFGFEDDDASFDESGSPADESAEGTDGTTTSPSGGGTTSGAAPRENRTTTGPPGSTTTATTNRTGSGAVPNRLPTVTIAIAGLSGPREGVVNVTGTASDPDGNATILRVEVSFSGRPFTNASGTRVSWWYTIPTTKTENGLRNVTARACDAAGCGNATVALTIDNNDPPTVAFVWAPGPAPLTGRVNVSWNATDPEAGPLRYRLYLENATGLHALSPTDLAATSFEWETGATTNGDGYRLKVVARDDHGKTAESYSARFDVVNVAAPAPPPDGDGTTGGGSLLDPLVPLVDSTATTVENQTGVPVTNTTTPLTTTVTNTTSGLL
ncbi:MAG: hypothetical protein ACT4PT_02550, partial [Methanobacteriota archaeon]